MTTDVKLYIGTVTNYSKYKFVDSATWDAVHSQIVAAMAAGSGTIKIARKDDTITYVYNQSLMVSWVDASTT